MPKRTINPTFIPRDGLVGERLLDGNGNDTSGNGNDGTVSGVTWVSADRGYVEKAGSFDGTNDQVTADGQDFNGTDNFSISFWINVDTLPTAGDNGTNDGYIFISTYENGDLDIWDKAIGMTKDGKFYIYTASSGSNISFSTNTFSAGSRYNVVGSFNGSTLKVYVNSEEEGSISAPGSFNFTNPKIGISTDHSAGTSDRERVDGQIGLVRIYDRALDQNEIDTLYLEGLRKLGKQTALTSNGFPYYSLPKLENGKVLDISKPANAGTYYDQTGGGNNGTNNGVVDSSNGQFNVMTFDGSNDYIATSLTPTTDFTWSGWVNTETPSTAHEGIFTTITAGTGRDGLTLVDTGSGNDSFTFLGYSGNTFLGQIISEKYSSGFVHVVVTRDGSSDTAEIYLNGSLSNSGVISGVSTLENNFVLGRKYATTGTEFFAGQMADVKIYNRALTSTEVQQMYYGKYLG